jgi:hypothetical protein
MCKFGFPLRCFSQSSIHLSIPEGGAEYREKIFDLPLAMG